MRTAFELPRTGFGDRAGGQQNAASPRCLDKAPAFVLVYATLNRVNRQKTPANAQNNARGKLL